jgi:hypothetical protein
MGFDRLTAAINLRHTCAGPSKRLDVLLRCRFDKNEGNKHEGIVLGCGEISLGYSVSLAHNLRPSTARLSFPWRLLDRFTLLL